MGFGTSPAAEVRIEELELDSQARPSFRLATPAGSIPISLQLSGLHHALNAAAAAAVGLAAGLPLGEIGDALGQVSTISAHRMQVRSRPDGLLVIDDAYNANPESVRAALDALAVLAAGRRGASWAVLGEMRELGDESADLHAAVGRRVADIGIDHLVVVGEAANAIGSGARSVAGWRGTVDEVPDAGAAAAVLTSTVTSDDLVLVKASNAIRLWQVADALLAAAPGEAARLGVGA